MAKLLLAQDLYTDKLWLDLTTDHSLLTLKKKKINNNSECGYKDSLPLLTLQCISHASVLSPLHLPVTLVSFVFFNPPCSLRTQGICMCSSFCLETSLELGLEITGQGLLHQEMHPYLPEYRRVL